MTEAIREEFNFLHPDPLKRIDVLHVKVIRISADITGRPVVNQLRVVVCESVPNRRRFSVFVPRTFNLICGRCGAELEIIGEIKTLLVVIASS